MPSPEDPVPLGREYDDVIDVDAHRLDALVAETAAELGQPGRTSFGFAPSCHPQKTVKVLYRAGTGTLVLRCPDCNELVATIRVSR